MTTKVIAEKGDLMSDVKKTNTVSKKPKIIKKKKIMIFKESEKNDQ